MSIKIVNDIGAPVAVVAVDMLTEKMAPQYNEYAAYGLTALGYGMAWFNKGGDFVKNVGIASFPLTVRNLVNRFSKTTVTRPMSLPVSRAVKFNVNNAAPRMSSSREEYADIQLG